MAKAPAVLQATTAEMVRAAALAVTVAERATLSSATHGSNRLSGVGRKGAKLSVGFDMKGSGNPTALVRARGPYHLIESDTKAHVIIPRRRRRALAGNGFGPVASVQHPGTKGKRPWAKGLAASPPAVTKAVQVVGEKAVKKAFLA
jgi:hypothetical protein